MLICQIRKTFFSSMTTADLKHNWLLFFLKELSYIHAFALSRDISLIYIVKFYHNMNVSRLSREKLGVINKKSSFKKDSNPLCLTCSDSRAFKQWLLQLLPGHWKPTKSRFSCINTSTKSELKDFLSQKLLK